MQSYIKKSQKYGTEGAPTSLSKGRSKVWVFTNGKNISEKQLKIHFIKTLKDTFSCIGSGNEFFKCEQAGQRWKVKEKENYQWYDACILMWESETATKFGFSLKLTGRTKHLQRTIHLILNRSLKLHGMHLVIPVSLLSLEEERKLLAQTEISMLYMSKVRWDVSQPVLLFRARLSSGVAVLSPENW